MLSRILNLSFVIFKMNKLWMYNLRMCWVTGDDESRVAPVRAGDTGWRNFAAFGILWSPARGTPTRSRGWRDFSVNTWVCWRDLESMGWYTIRWYVIVMDSEFKLFLLCNSAIFWFPNWANVLQAFVICWDSLQELTAVHWKECVGCHDFDPQCQ